MKLPNRSAYISFYTSESDTMIFWLDDRDPAPRLFTAAISGPELAAAGQRLSTLFSKENINPRRPEQADITWLQPVSNALLSPLAEELNACSSLVVAPHQALHLLPLHLLSLAGVPLGISHTVTYMPNLSVYAMLLKRAAAYSRSYEQESISLIAAAREDPAHIRENFAIAPKAYAARTGGLIFEDATATKAVMRSYAVSSKSLYLSCHGVFEAQNPIDSALFLADENGLPSKARPDDTENRLSVRDILGLDISAKLVILDACLSGVQQLSSGDEPTGFPMGFLLAGGGAVIASGWSVEQQCAKFFMLALTEYWSSCDRSLGEAMRKAYADTRAQYPHPFSWAAFSLFGNDQLLFN